MYKERGITVDYNNVFELRKSLDLIHDKLEKEIRIEHEVNKLLNQGYSKQDILRMFGILALGEAQGNSAMIKNHQEYVELVKKVLEKK